MDKVRLKHGTMLAGTYELKAPLYVDHPLTTESLHLALMKAVSRGLVHYTPGPDPYVTIVGDVRERE